jgi:hypothetical protein
MSTKKGKKGKSTRVSGAAKGRGTTSIFPVVSRPSPGVVVLVGVVVFILIFTYLSLNLKNVDFGYEMQEKKAYRDRLLEEISDLKSRKARLLNLKRVEKEVMEKLGYRYPEPQQFIKVFVSGD